MLTYVDLHLEEGKSDSLRRFWIRFVFRGRIQSKCILSVKSGYGYFEVRVRIRFVLQDGSGWSGSTPIGSATLL